MAVKRILEKMGDLDYCLTEYRQLEQQLYELETSWPNFRSFYQEKFNQSPIYNIQKNEPLPIEKEKQSKQDKIKELNKFIQELTKTIPSDSTEARENRETIKEYEEELAELRKLESVSHGFVRVLRGGVD